MDAGRQSNGDFGQGSADIMQISSVQVVIKSVKEFQIKWSIIEYVDKSDPMARLLLGRPTLDYSSYTFENFINALTRNYTEVTVLRRLSETRTLI